jgi:hypothetical protein
VAQIPATRNVPQRVSIPFTTPNDPGLIGLRFFQQKLVLGYPALIRLTYHSLGGRGVIGR